MPFYIYTDEMYHHGIKGQRWGIRRYQNKDGSLTPAGKKRYSDGDGEQKKSRYDKYYEKYKTLGYDDEKAAKAAKGRVAVERSLIVAGSVAVAATAAYAGYRYWDNTKDRMISPEQVMQTVHKGDATTRMQPGAPFYATYGKKDNTIYASKVFSHFTDESKITKFYTEDGIKVASEKTGRKILDDLIKTNPEVKAYAEKLGDSGDAKKRYHKFNWSLVLRNDSDTIKGTRFEGLEHDKVHNIFYDELRKRGYGGIIDTNDSKSEGFTFNPVIVFDKQKKHVISSTKATKEHLGKEQLEKGLKYAMQRKTSLNPANNQYVMAEGAAFLYSVGLHTESSRKLNDQVKFVNDYKADHPNTKLTNAEIAEMYKN
jgi:hypothetical protein